MRLVFPHMWGPHMSATQRASWGGLGPSWHLLGPTWANLGTTRTLLGPTGRHLGTPRTSKTKISLERGIKIVEIGFSWFGGSWGLSWAPRQRLLGSLGSLWASCWPLWGCLGLSLAPLGLPKRAQSRKKTLRKEVLALRGRPEQRRPAGAEAVCSEGGGSV